MGSIGWPEIILIVIVVVLIFGARKIPEIGRGIGEGIRNFRKAMKGDSEEKTDKGESKDKEKK